MNLCMEGLIKAILLKYRSTTKKPLFIALGEQSSYKLHICFRTSASQGPGASGFAVKDYLLSITSV